MNFKRLSILFCFVLTTMVSSAMRYQIKVLNTPTIRINDKELKVGDWFDDQAVIIWSKENQAMRVLSENNRIYTLSAKLCREINVNKFADFILYTKPLAARGNKSASLKEILEEKFDNSFIMLDKIELDLSEIELPENFRLNFIVQNKENYKGDFIISNSIVRLNRMSIRNIALNGFKTISLSIYMQIGQDAPILITDYMDIEILPLDLEVQVGDY